MSKIKASEIFKQHFIDLAGVKQQAKFSSMEEAVETFANIKGIDFETVVKGYRAFWYVGGLMIVPENDLIEVEPICCIRSM